QIQEWRPADFSHPGPFEAALLAALFVGFSRGVRVSPLRLLLLLGLTHLALQHSRHQILLAVIAPMLLAEPRGRALAADEPGPRARTGALATAAAPLCAAAAVALLGLRLALPVQRVDGPMSPISALAHVPSEVLAQPVFNDSGFGGYLIF